MHRNNHQVSTVCGFLLVDEENMITYCAGCYKAQKWGNKSYTSTWTYQTNYGSQEDHILNAKKSLSSSHYGYTIKYTIHAYIWKAFLWLKLRLLSFLGSRTESDGLQNIGFFSKSSIFPQIFKHSHSKHANVQHITPEAGLSPIKSTIAENGMGMTSRP